MAYIVLYSIIDVVEELAASIISLKELGLSWVGSYDCEAWVKMEASMFLQNAGIKLQHYTLSKHRRLKIEFI
jgi:hypothetical protein